MVKLSYQPQGSATGRLGNLVDAHREAPIELRLVPAALIDIHALPEDDHHLLARLGPVIGPDFVGLSGRQYTHHRDGVG